MGVARVPRRRLHGRRDLAVLRGLRRVGPSAASILSTVEPVVTVALAFVVFGESLGTAQLVGGALVLSAVLAVRAPLRVRVPEPAQGSLVRSNA